MYKDMSDIQKVWIVFCSFFGAPKPILTSPLIFWLFESTFLLKTAKAVQSILAFTQPTSQWPVKLTTTSGL